MAAPIGARPANRKKKASAARADRAKII